MIQNDIGTTDAHVLVVHVEGLAATLTYTDVHLQRLLFFQSLFDRSQVDWDDTLAARRAPWRTASTTCASDASRRATAASWRTTSHSSARAWCS